MDMGSRNGPFVNGSPVSFPILLKDFRCDLSGRLSAQFPLAGKSSANGGSERPHRRSTYTGAVRPPQKLCPGGGHIRGFTQLSQQIDPSLLCNLIGSWFREGGQLMQEKGSWSQEYFGDALMSV
jgi:adenylate cyclase